MTQGQDHMKHCPLQRVTYVPAKFEVAKALVKEMHLQENTLFDLDPKVKGSSSHEILPSTLNIMWPIQLQSLKLLPLAVKEKMHLQENTLFDPGVKVTGNVAQCILHHVTYAPTKFEVTESKG